MSERVPIDPERLLAQTAWVRRLARSLARDEASADDLVQETFAAALRRPPAGAQDEPRLRAWFGFVLRNMAFRRSRSEARREERERRSAQGGRSESDERADELEDLRAELFKHVKALPETSREVVLLRYFEELDSAEIARRLGVPDSTVRNRLRRALAELRERLERDHGSDWRSLCLFALPNTGAKVAAGGGALAAAGAMWWGAGAVVLVALFAFLAWPREDRARAAGPVLAVPIVPERALDPENGRVREAETTERRAEVAPSSTPATEATAAAGNSLNVEGTVLDEAGRPAADFTMAWYDEQGSVRYPNLGLGSFVLENAHAGRWMVALSGWGWQSRQTDVVLEDSPPVQHCDLRVQSTRVLAVRLVDRSGRSLVRPVSSGRLPLPNTLTVVASKHTLADPVPPLALRTRDDYRGSARFWDLHSRSMTRREEPETEGCLGVLELFDEPPLHAALVDGNSILVRQELDPDVQEITFVLAEEELAQMHLARRAGLKLRVVLPGGASAANCKVRVDSFPTGSMPLGPDGRGEATDLAPGLNHVGISCPGYTRVELTYDLLAGEVRDVGEIRLAPQRWLTVRFQLPDDANDFVSFKVARETEAVAGGRYLEPDVREQRAFGGACRIPWPGTGTFVLRVSGIGQQPPPGNHEVRNDYHAGARPVRFELGDASPDEMTVAIVHTQRVVLRPPADASRSALWLVATDDGLPCRPLVTEGRAPLPIELAPGKYEIFELDEWTGAFGDSRRFEVGTEPLSLELPR